MLYRELRLDAIVFTDSLRIFHGQNCPKARESVGMSAIQKEPSYPWRILIFATIAIVGSGLDLWTKAAVFEWRGLPNERPPWWLIRDMVGIETAVNIGALFGMGAGFGWLFALASIVASVGIFVWLFAFGAVQSRWLTVALGCVMGGIIGNLYDRLGFWHRVGMPSEWKSGVRDWILLCYGQYTWPNFNIADSLLVCGAIMLAWHSIRNPNSY
jgi:signal peptidase II